MEMSLAECAAQLGAAMLALKQLGAQADAMKISAFLLGLGIALGLGIMVTSLFYEWHFQAGIAFQRQLDSGLHENTALESTWRDRIKGWSDMIEQFATMERR